MTKLFILIMVLMPALVWAEDQDCTITYLGVNSGQQELGEPNVTMLHPHSFMGVGKRKGASYQTTNVFQLYWLDIDRTIANNAAVVNVFEFTCVTPE